METLTEQVGYLPDFMVREKLRGSSLGLGMRGREPGFAPGESSLLLNQHTIIEHEIMKCWSQQNGKSLEKVEVDKSQVRLLVGPPRPQGKCSLNILGALPQTGSLY